MDKIALRENKTYFSLKDGSNYKVMMTYDRSEVIEYEQFKKLMVQLNDEKYRFLTINQRVVNKNTIIDISPTEEKTQSQKEELARNPKEVLIDDGNGNPVKLSDITKNDITPQS